MLLAVTIVRAAAAALAFARGGVYWRGTFSRTPELRAGQRFGVG